jgi:hypothetical protein
MALQALPDWLRDLAVVNPVVQKILNQKISKRFPTAVTLMDFVFYILVISFFQVSVIESLADRYNPDEPDTMNMGNLAPLYLAVIYFTTRELIQAVSLGSLGLFSTWVYDPTNWFDTVYIILILFWTICMQNKTLNHYSFQVGSAITLGVFWVNVLLFLKGLIVGFAVFVGGVVYVVKRLAAFLLALLIILLAFSQMFYTVFRQSDQCPNGSGGDTSQYIVSPGEGEVCGIQNATGIDRCILVDPEICEPINDNPWCNFWSSFYKVYSMLLGEVDDNDFEGSELAIFLFAAFMFGVVIVLANVLIAIVTDSYSVIKNERAGKLLEFGPD